MPLDQAGREEKVPSGAGVPVPKGSGRIGFL